MNSDYEKLKALKPHTTYPYGTIPRLVGANLVSVPISIVWECTSCSTENVGKILLGHVYKCTKCKTPIVGYQIKCTGEQFSKFDDYVDETELEEDDED